MTDFQANIVLLIVIRVVITLMRINLFHYLCTIECYFPLNIRLSLYISKLWNQYVRAKIIHQHQLEEHIQIFLELFVFL